MSGRPEPTPEEIAALPYRPCVGLMILNRESAIFVGQRLDFRSDAWQMPQGGIDKGEAPLEAALRELWEETGITRDKVTLLAEGRETARRLQDERDHVSARGCPLPAPPSSPVRNTSSLSVIRLLRP